jgi:PDZ domain-containing secreted protein
MDIFFCPKDNYQEALEVYNNMNTNMQLVCVSKFSDCLEYLGGLE